MGCNVVPLAALTKPQCGTHTNYVRVYSFMLYDDRYLSNTKQFPLHNTTNSVDVRPENSKPFSCDLNKVASVGNKRPNILLYVTFSSLT